MMKGIVESGLPLRARIAMLLRARTRLEALVALHRGRRIFKFRHFYAIYGRHFARFRGREMTLLEIGLGQGGSLEIWRRYFGPGARIVGVDIRPECRAYAVPGSTVEIGSQDDPTFLDYLARTYGPFDILIDDGSHIHAHQLATFRALFPHIKPNGLYVCEDLCSSYWEEEYGGGVGKPGTHAAVLKTLVDEVNGWFWRDDPAEPGSLTPVLNGLHFYPALAIVEKAPMEHPVVVHVGREERAAVPAESPAHSDQPEAAERT